MGIYKDKYIYQSKSSSVYNLLFEKSESDYPYTDLVKVQKEE